MDRDQRRQHPQWPWAGLSCKILPAFPPEVVRARPDARYLYVADGEYFPYGRLGEEQIIDRVVPLFARLLKKHAPDLAVIACNTASTLVLSHLRAAYKVPFVGTVPAIKPACASSKSGRASVLGTSGTIRREYTRALIRDFAGGCQVSLVGSADLASLAEKALRGGEVGDAALPGRSRDGAPDRNIQQMPLRTRRSSTIATPRFLVRKERSDGSPLEVREFVSHDSRPRFGSLNHACLGVRNAELQV